MTESATGPASAALPFHDPSRRRRLLKVAAWLAGVGVAVVVLRLLGVDVVGWFKQLWDQIKAVPRRLHRRGTVLPDSPDAACRALLLRHPARRLPGSGAALADRDRLRRGRVDEQLPAREHRHLRDTGDVRGDHPARHVRRLDRRLPRAEDLLHDRGDVRLPLPLPLRPRFVRREPRQPLSPPGRLHPPRCRRRHVGRRRGPRVLEAAEEALESGQGGRRDPQPAHGVPDPRVPPLAPLLAVQADRDRDLPRRLRHPRHVRVDHVGDRIGLAGECRVLHPRRGRNHPGHECAGAGHLLRRPAERHHRLLQLRSS